MTERETLAREVAGDNYGLSLDGYSREWKQGRLEQNERKAFDAGWEAAKQYYTNVPNIPEIPS